ncbi:GNAT family N-acetyltransferase [Clostridium felsineum]|uniref:GNAT family N-acetyltransferase n=1 Tax=Clostridium felsineum TaxID=36839 RepID=UPI0009CD786D|nr:GNAT family protein [Clostridium felsineum]URZ14569.1 hypothetical protein CLFE_005660 [Clostridium felsineum DSM 794]
MDLNITEMDYNKALEISNWNYEKQFSIYNMNGSEECIKELLHGDYFAVLDNKNNLVGYYGFGAAARVPLGEDLGLYNDDIITDIGLGLNPNLCGHGVGFDFFNCGLNFAKSKLNAKNFRLTVTTFNKAAIKIYLKLGFKKVVSFPAMSSIGEIEFWIMTLVG